MTVRRLAEQSSQPPTFAFNEANSAWVEKLLKNYPEGRQQSAIIPMMMRAQDQEGWVTKAAIETIADMLGMAYIRALEVATFYTQFQLKPVGTRAHVQVCGTTPCMIRGAGDLIEVCRSKIHEEQFHTNADGTLSWEEVECLGACVNAPMIMIFKDTYEDLTPERLAEIIDQFEGGLGADVPTGPQNGRFVSAPITGFTSLTDEGAIMRPDHRNVPSAPAADQAGAISMPPSNAGKPSTRAVETDASLVTPSPQKVEPGAEPRQTPIASHDPVAANQAEPAVEVDPKQRTPSSDDGGDAAMKSPELLHGEALGPTGKRPAGDQPAPEGARSPEGGNMTRKGTPQRDRARKPKTDDGGAS